MRLSYPLAILVAFAVSLASVRLLSGSHLAGLIVDLPNERSLHDRPTPRTGGVGLTLGVAVAWLLFSELALPVVVALAGALAAFFLLEDAKGLPMAVRFALQIVAAIVFLWASGPYPLLLAPLLVVGIAWSSNLYNFMDGSDGLAGGMTLIGFAVLALAAHAAGHRDIAVLAAIVSAAAAGFLVWNFHPARIFLGDTGSIPLGLLAGMLGVLGWQRGAWAFWFPLLVFLPFVVDATVTLATRILRKEEFWKPHRTHYYQRMIQSGWSHRRLALAAYGLMLTAGGSALLLRHASGLAATSLLAIWAAACLWIAVLVNRRWRAFNARQTALATSGGPATAIAE